MKKRHSLTAYESPLKQRNSCQLTHNTKENVLFFICCAATGVKLNHHITIENASFEYVWYGFTLQTRQNGLQNNWLPKFNKAPELL